MLDDATQRLIEIGKLKPFVPPSIPAGQTVSLPADDDAQHEETKDLAGDIGAAYFITYIKNDGSSSKRRITIKKIAQNSKGNIMLYCYCHERKALRSFRADRIQEAIDLSTGEVISDFSGVLNNLSGQNITRSEKDPSPTSMILSRCKHPLNILVFLGRSDGKLHRREVDVIYQFITDIAVPKITKKVAAPPQNGLWLRILFMCLYKLQLRRRPDDTLDKKEVQNHINRMYPDHDTYVSSIKNLKSKKEFQEVLHYACQLIQADGTITKDELLFVEEMMQQHLEAQ